MPDKGHRQDDPARGYDYGHKLLEEYWDDAGILNQIAWYTTTKEAIKTRDLDFAMKAAKRASELKDDEDAAILDTVAQKETSNRPKLTSALPPKADETEGSPQSP